MRAIQAAGTRQAVEVRRTVLVDHAAEVMFDLIEAAEHYPAFVPGCSAVEILERSDEVVAARLTMKLAGIALVMHTRNPKRRPTWMLIEMQPGASRLMRRFRGEWQLTPLNARACRIDFTLSYELDGAVARVAQTAFDRVADRLVDAFVQRADRLQPPPPLFVAAAAEAAPAMAAVPAAPVAAAAVPAAAGPSPETPSPNPSHEPDLSR
jgi:ribosome-associated toxin RatA of RatAB toxin-antitoxin module